MVCGVADSAWDAAARDLYARFLSGEVSPEVMAAEFPPIWRFRSDSDPLSSDAAWRAMAEHAAYFVWASGQPSGRRDRRPFRARQLFRGATADRRLGMSWTANLDIARHFARHRQPPGVDDGQVWVGVFAPSRLLAHLKDEGEYLVDAAGIDVQLWSLEDAGWLTRRRRGV